jgi:hypothetical protein
MVYIGKWQFGVHMDAYSWGFDFMVGLGPIAPRVMRICQSWEFSWQVR